MSYKIENGTTGLVDYKELEANILSSIREGRPLMGRDGALTPFVIPIPTMQRTDRQ